MKTRLTQIFTKGALTCIMVSACLLFIGALQTADSRIHRKPDFKQFLADKSDAVRTVELHYERELPWANKEKIVFSEDTIKPIILPWENKNNKVLYKKEVKKTQVTYISPKNTHQPESNKNNLLKSQHIELYELDNNDSKEQENLEVTENVKSNIKKISIKDVIAQKVNVETIKLDHNNDIFGKEVEVVSNQELSDVRGAGLFAGGLDIDLNWFTETLLNGESVNTVNLSAQDLINRNPALARRVTYDENGLNISNLDTGDVQRFMTVIQNSVDNVVIDNTTTLNIQVNNGATFIQQSRMPLINHQIVGSLQ